MCYFTSATALAPRGSTILQDPNGIFSDRSLNAHSHERLDGLEQA
jgi:hypothetical protein